jgi:hypothetical protein
MCMQRVVGTLGTEQSQLPLMYLSSSVYVAEVRTRAGGPARHSRDAFQL